MPACSGLWRFSWEDSLETIKLEKQDANALPMRLGGLGLRSAQRIALGAFWASWFDALHMIHERLPAVARTITHKLLDDAEHDGCLGELKRAPALLDLHDFADGSATTAREHCRARGGHMDGNTTRHLLLSTSSGGPWCWAMPVPQIKLTYVPSPAMGFALSGTPTNPEFKVEPHHFRALVLERMRLPLRVTEAKCECGADLDSLERHCAACPRSGRLRTRVLGPEKTLARILPGGRRPLCNAMPSWTWTRSVCTGREGNRSSRIGAPTAPRSAACGQRHSPVRPTLQRRTAQSAQEPELTKNASTPSSLQETSSGGGGIGNRRKVEQRSHSVYQRSCGGPIKGSTTK